MNNEYMNQFIDRPHYGYYVDIDTSQENFETTENNNIVYIMLGVIATACVLFLCWLRRQEKTQQNKRYTSISYV